LAFYRTHTINRASATGVATLYTFIYRLRNAIYTPVNVIYARVNLIDSPVNVIYTADNGIVRGRDGDDGASILTHSPPAPVFFHSLDMLSLAPPVVDVLAP
jgi:hypothetical protein